MLRRMLSVTCHTEEATGSGNPGVRNDLTRQARGEPGAEARWQFLPTTVKIPYNRMVSGDNILKAHKEQKYL